MSAAALLIKRQDFRSLIQARWLAAWGSLVGTIVGGSVSFFGDTRTGTALWAAAIVIPIIQAWGFVRKYPIELLGRMVRRFALVQFAYGMGTQVPWSYGKETGWSPESLQTLSLLAASGSLFYGLLAHFALRRFPLPNVDGPQLRPSHPRRLRRREEAQQSWSV
jgi:hypothetical protein